MSQGGGKRGTRLTSNEEKRLVAKPYPWTLGEETNRLNDTEGRKKNHFGGQNPKNIGKKITNRFGGKKKREKDNPPGKDTTSMGRLPKGKKRGAE